MATITDWKYQLVIDNQVVDTRYSTGEECEQDPFGPHGGIVVSTPMHAVKPRDREADRARFSDPNFNRWLDEPITENGEFTAWDTLSSTGDAYAGWSVRPNYEPVVAPPTLPQPQLRVYTYKMQPSDNIIPHRLGMACVESMWPRGGVTLLTVG